ncbi:unnamed protein product [Cladocopium goreaui]|uniref:Retrovirus-related Pol polyprotein from transposon RE1 (Retro element 1) (AtRE1) n=1 Tax=Cladocopium goreaui TaxID=2562237 RepID=A0A9P1GFY6_9DINO|nr:unnamed protein product [Cladocopium goreaui]
MPEGASRERSSTHPRDGRVPASSDPTSRMRGEGRGDGVPGDAQPALADVESAECPEILSPEEAEERRKDKAQPLKRRSNAEVQVEEPRLMERPNAPVDDAVALPAEQAVAAVAQPPKDGLPAWTKHDLGFALQQLRSIREGVVRRTLRKLHLRWYHAGSRKMQVLLEAAGVNPQILAMIPSIIDTCDICRHWQRPGPKLFGPPTNILSDQEGGLITDLVGDWMDRRGIQVCFRARGQHCGMVERHNEILRRQLHLLEDQSNAEGLAVTFSTVLAEAVFAKNAMFQLGNATPYEAIFGRHPPLMATVSEESGEGISDRDAYTIRRLAISSMIQATADSKARQVAPDIPHLGGSHEPDMPDMNDKTDEVLRAKGPKPLQNAPQINPNSEADSPNQDGNVPTSNEAASSLFADADEASYDFQFQNVISDISFLGTFHDEMPACPGHVVCGEFSNFVSAEELTEPPELLLPGNMLTYVTLLTTRHSPKLNLNEPPELLLPGNMLTYVTLLTTRHSPKLNLNEWLCLSFASGAETTAVIERQSTDTYAGTSTRWGQRLLITIAVQRKWALWSADISEAFLPGLTFRELHEEGGELREVQITLPPGGEHLLRTIQGYSDFDPDAEVLVMLKPGFGLKDAPRLWLKALKRVLTKIGVSPTKVDPQLLCMHRNGELVLLMTIHVDDIKLCGHPSIMQDVVKQLESHFDAVKLEKDNFVHLGRQPCTLDCGRSLSSNSQVPLHAPTGECTCTGWPDNCFDEPKINPKVDGVRQRFSWGVIDDNGMLRLTKQDHETHEVFKWEGQDVSRELPWQPVFVPEPYSDKEDAGVVMSFVRDQPTGNSFCIVLDAATMTEKARIHFPEGHHIPLHGHGTFIRA